jgi:hypothetical protein
VAASSTRGFSKGFHGRRSPFVDPRPERWMAPIARFAMARATTSDAREEVALLGASLLQLFARTFPAISRQVDAPRPRWDG